jgi:hypothetical protein
VGGGVQLGPLGTAAINRPIVPAALGDYDNGEIGGMIVGKGNRSTERKSGRAAFSTTNPTCCPDANTGRRSGKPATNRLSYGAAELAHKFKWGITQTDTHTHTHTHSHSLTHSPPPLSLMIELIITFLFTLKKGK